MGVKCVKCGSNNTAEYLYGLPKFDDKLEKDINDGKVELGGCEVCEFDPKYHCNECDNDFGFSAKRLCNGEFTDYIEETVYYMFSLNYTQYGETRFILYKENDKYFVEFHTPSKKFSDEISEKEYKKNLVTIFEKALVLEWNEKYERSIPVEMNSWKIEIKCSSGKIFTSSGKDYFPPYFKKAKTRHDYYSTKYLFNK